MSVNNEDMRFDGKIVVITGASSGIGEASVREFARSNATVAMIDRKPEDSKGVAAEMRAKGAALDYFEADVSSRASVERAVAVIVARFGGVDVLANNAGIQRYGTVTTLTEEE